MLRWTQNLDGLARRSLGWIRNRFASRPHAKLRVGVHGEQIAADFLQRLGYRILQRSYRASRGEIDLIALDRRTIVFVEVKTWSQPAEGGPSDAVHADKQRRITDAALEYLKRHRLLHQASRFDVVEIVLMASIGDQQTAPASSIRHYPNAFDAFGKFQMYS